MEIDRRDFIKLAGLGGIVFASGLGGRILGAARPKQEEFYFVQLSDTHIGRGILIRPRKTDNFRE